MHWLLTLIFLTPMILYVLLSRRDAVSDLREVFDMRIVRRSMRRKQISVLGMMIITIMAALFFRYVRDWNVPVARWPILLLLIAFATSMVKLAQIAIQDATSKGVRRRSPSRNTSSTRTLRSLARPLSMSPLPTSGESPLTNA